MDAGVELGGYAFDAMNSDIRATDTAQSLDNATVDAVPPVDAAAAIPDADRSPDTDRSRDTDRSSDSPWLPDATASGNVDLPLATSSLDGPVDLPPSEMGIDLALEAPADLIDVAPDLPNLPEVARDLAQDLFSDASTNKLDVGKTGAGAGTITSSPAGITCGSTCNADFATGTLVTLSATADGTSTFTGWSGACSGTGVCVVSVDATTSATANFAVLQNGLSIARTGTGNGTVVSSPAGISCGSVCAYDFNVGTTVTLTATPDATSTFAGWSGACTGTGTCVLATNAAQSVTATFDKILYSLTVAKTGSGGGVVSSLPAGISCAATCDHAFEIATAVALTATADTQSTFTGWSGPCSGTGTCLVTMSMVTSVTANFDLNTFSLSVSKTGVGSGTIASSPSGIDCGSTCAANFGQETVVTLTATPDGTSAFAGWSGGCSGLGNCVVTLLADVSASARFLRAAGGTCTSNTDCQAGLTCLDGVCCTQSTCPQCLNCGNSGTCNVVVSNTEDTTGVVCSGATSCNAAGACKSKNGETCSLASDCASASASCTDNRCCAQTCGVCQTCTGSGGSCATLTNADDPDSCTGVSTCDAAGACKKKNGQVCAVSTDCASGICSGSICAAVSAQSCAGLAANCGPSANESCCTALAVPGGTFNRRNNSNYPATLSNFVLDKYDVTVGRFRSFVNAGRGTQALPPAAGDGAHPLILDSGWNPGWNSNLPATTVDLTTALKCNSAFQTWTDAVGPHENLPMNCLDWYQAFAFCAWDGGRVPTQAECNYAGAGGSEQRLYPWGSASPPYDTSLATYYCYYGGTNGCVGVVNIAPVGTRPAGNGKWGHSDLAGNIWEWNLDWYFTPTVPCVDCADLTVRYAHVVRSGAFSDGPDTLQTVSRDGYPPTTRDFHVGVRCARGGQ